jgi:hypothetical protein
MALNISWLDAVTLKSINPKAMEDLVFRKGALLAYARKNQFEPYEGGVSMDEAVVYDSMIGGFYDTGAPMSTDVVQPIAGLTFTPRKSYVTISEYEENLAINRGPAAVFSALRTKHRVAINTLNSIWNIAMWRHGQSLTSPAVDNRLKFTNGIEEALNDGVTQSWRGNLFPIYGGQTRNAEVASGYNGLNSIPYFCGNSSTGAAGQITYDKLVDIHLRATEGDRMPNLILTNKALWGFCLKRVQTQQHFVFNRDVGTDAVYGARSIKFLNTDIVVDNYAPSATTQSGTNEAKLGDYSTAATVTISGTPSASSNIPSSGTFVPGEVGAMLNTDTWKFRLSTHPSFKFGFTGYIPNQIDSLLVGRIRAMGTYYCSNPGLNTIFFGVNS